MASLKVKPKEYYLATIHRADNTDNIENLRNIFDALTEIGKNKSVIIPLHPRTKKALESAPFLVHNPNKSIKTIEPVSYFDMLILEKNAKKIRTDTWGIQKEAYLLGVPCVTLRNETEWVETLENGWNVIVETNKKRIINIALRSTLVKNDTSYPLFGDAKAAEKILKCLCF